MRTPGIRKCCHQRTRERGGNCYCKKSQNIPNLNLNMFNSIGFTAPNTRPVLLKKALDPQIICIKLGASRQENSKQKKGKVDSCPAELLQHHKLSRTSQMHSAMPAWPKGEQYVALSWHFTLETPYQTLYKLLNTPATQI